MRYTAHLAKIDCDGGPPRYAQSMGRDSGGSYYALLAALPKFSRGWRVVVEDVVKGSASKERGSVGLLRVSYSSERRQHFRNTGVEKANLNTTMSVV